jgi:hypothetical protein
VVIGLVGGFILSLWADDWQPYRVFFEFLGVVMGAICIYAAGVWTVGHLAAKFSTALKKLRHKHDGT